MTKDTAIRALVALADQRKRERNPNFPAKYIPKSRYNDRDANGLTACVVDWINYSGHFATRLQSTGTYRDDIKKFVSSQQRPGMPDVFGIVSGHAVHVEVKIGNDTLSDVQKQTIQALKDSGASVFIAKDFASFLGWFLALTAAYDKLADSETEINAPNPINFISQNEPSQRLTNSSPL